MLQKWIDKKQYICFSIDELFSWQDKLDELEENDNESKAWDLFNDFLNEAESHLEYSEEFINELQKIHQKVEDGDYSDFVEVEFEDLFDDEMSDDELGKCCHTCANCTSDEEEYLTCVYYNELKDFDDVCDKWELDEGMV